MIEPAVTLSSKALAKTWPIPRHDAFERRMRAHASSWFRARSFATLPAYPYILAHRGAWPQNIILPEVVAYINGQRAGFPLHKYIHHGLSSQAMLFNLIGPLLVRADLAPLHAVLARHRVVLPEDSLQGVLEYEDRTVFREDTGQPTSIDLVLRDASGKAAIFIESKFVEREFGGCSVFANGDCDGRNPAADHSICYLHHVGRRYWTLMQKHCFLTDAMQANLTCVFAAYYQYFREVLFALEKGGSFVLLYDARNPTFVANDSERGLIPFLLSLTPLTLRDRIAAITIQEVASAVRETGRHEWLDEFDAKYGLG
jgi:hypothetical protein